MQYTKKRPLRTRLGREAHRSRDSPARRSPSGRL